MGQELKIKLWEELDINSALSNRENSKSYFKKEEALERLSGKCTLDRGAKLTVESLGRNSTPHIIS